MGGHGARRWSAAAAGFFLGVFSQAAVAPAASAQEFVRGPPAEFLRHPSLLVPPGRLGPGCATAFPALRCMVWERAVAPSGAAERRAGKRRGARTEPLLRRVSARVAGPP